MRVIDSRLIVCVTCAVAQITPTKLIKRLYLPGNNDGDRFRKGTKFGYCWWPTAHETWFLKVCDSNSVIIDRENQIFPYEGNPNSDSLNNVPIERQLTFESYLYEIMFNAFSGKFRGDVDAAKQFVAEICKQNEITDSDIRSFVLSASTIEDLIKSLIKKAKSSRGMPLELPEENEPLAENHHGTPSLPHFRKKDPKTIGPSAGDFYIDRPEIIEAIENAFSEKKMVVLSALSGMGKSELARQYAKCSSCEVVIPLTLNPDGAGSFEDIVKSAAIVIDGMSKEISPEDELKLRLNLIGSASQDVLLIVDNFNRLDQQLFKTLKDKTGQAKVLLTSQIDAVFEDSYSAFCKAISLNPDESGSNDSNIAFCRQVFLRHYEMECAPDNQAAIDKILSLVGHHTMLAALLARQAHLYGDSIEDLLETLSSSLSDSLQQEDYVVAIKDYERETYSSPYELLIVLFQNVLRYQFEEIDRQVLGALILTPSQWHYKSVICELVGDLPERRSNCRKANAAVRRLREAGIIQVYSRSDHVVQTAEDYLELHPLLFQLVQDTDATGTGNAIAELSNNYAFHLMRNAFVSRSEFFGDYGNNGFWKLENRLMKLIPDWVSGTFVSNLGWLSRLPISAIERLNQSPNLFLAIIYNERTNSLKFEDVQSVFSHNPDWPWDTDAPAHNCLEVIAQGPDGASFYLYDCVSEKSFNILNYSQQLLPKFRYWGTYSGQDFQHGELTDAFICGCYKDVTLCLNPFVFPSEVSGIPVTCVKYLPLEGIGSRILEFPSNCKRVGGRPFLLSSDHLEEVHFSEGLEEIGDQAFRYSENLHSVTIPNSIKLIGRGSFLDCPNLRSILLPVGVKLKTVFWYTSVYDYIRGCESTEDIEVWREETFELGSEIALDADGHLILDYSKICNEKILSGKWTHIAFPFDAECRVSIMQKPKLVEDTLKKR